MIPLCMSKRKRRTGPLVAAGETEMMRRTHHLNILGVEMLTTAGQAEQALGAQTEALVAMLPVAA
jgi:hypothetical protein